MGICDDDMQPEDRVALAQGGARGLCRGIACVIANSGTRYLTPLFANAVH